MLHCNARQSRASDSAWRCTYGSNFLVEKRTLDKATENRGRGDKNILLKDREVGDDISGPDARRGAVGFVRGEHVVDLPLCSDVRIVEGRRRKVTVVCLAHTNELALGGVFDVASSDMGEVRVPAGVLATDWGSLTNSNNTICAG